MDAAWELGITTFDTADAYGGGRSETWIGEWLAAKGPDGARRDHDRDEDVQPDGRTARIAASRGTGSGGRSRRACARLGLERVPLYMAHAHDPDTPVEETLAAFDELVRAGKVGAVGASNFSAEQLAEAVEISELEGLARYEWAQNSFSLLDRDDAETVFPVCHEHGLGYEAFGPLAGGWLAGRYRRGESYPEGSRMTQRPGRLPQVRDGRGLRRARGVRARGARTRRVDGRPRARLAARRARGHGRRRRPDARRAARAGARGALARALGRRARPSARLVPMIVLSEHDVRELLDMESCIEAMTEVLASLARGELYNPLRSIARPPEAPTRCSGSCPRTAAAPTPAYALKEIVIVPDEPVARPRHAHGRRPPARRRDRASCVAIMNASPITEIRTAAVSAVATRALARPDAQRVAILGAGAQARGHVHAMRAVLDDPEIRIWARRLEAAEELAGEVGATVAPSVDAALFGAEVVCTTTGAVEPIVEKRWLARGAHVNAVGSLLPDDARARHRDGRELVVLHRPPRVVPERGGRLHPRRGRGRDRPRPHQGRARRGARRDASRAASTRTS